jgi:hypothetical protein
MASRAPNTRHIEVFDLPSHRPELNTDLKRAISAKVSVRTKATLHAGAADRVAMIDVDPDRVKPCFQDPRVEYVA